MGLKYNYEPVEGKDEVLITITDNPHGVTNDELKARIEQELGEVSAGVAGVPAQGLGT